MKLDRMKRAALKSIPAAIALAAISAVTPAFAQSAAAKWPSAPVRFVVPFPAGAAPDVVIRYVGVKLTEKWGQTVIVDNRPGGSGVIGMNAILQAPADGATFGFVQGSAISIAPSTIKGVQWEFARDFVPVTLATVTPLVLAVSSDLPQKTLKEFMDMARAKPQSMEVADPGRATLPHLAGALVGLNGNAQFLEVHYPGGAQSMQATMAGQTKMMVDSYNVMQGNVEGGRMRVLGVMSDRVEPGLEKFPVAKDTVPGAVAYGWFAVIGKKGLDPAIVAKLNKDIADVMAMPDVVKKMTELGNYVRTGTPEQLAQFIIDDRKIWQPVIEKLGIKPE